MNWLLSQNPDSTADGNSLVYEYGGWFRDDGYASKIREGKMNISLAPNDDNKNCCKNGLGGKGIRVKVKFETTDHVGSRYSNDSGVVSTELSVITDPIKNPVLKNLGRKDYDSTEETATEDGFTTEERIVCVLCTAIIKGIIYFVLKITDDDGNSRTILQPENIGAEATVCCKSIV